MSKKGSKDKKLTVIDSQDSPEISLKKRVEALFPGEYNIVQVILQEIQAVDLISDATDNITTPLTAQIETLKSEISIRFAQDKEVEDLLLEYIPPYTTIVYWIGKAKWKDIVIEKAKSDFSISSIRRITILNDLFNKGHVQGDTKAIELFLKISGDLDSGKTKTDSKEVQTYKELSESLIRKK